MRICDKCKFRKWLNVKGQSSTEVCMNPKMYSDGKIAGLYINCSPRFTECKYLESTPVGDKEG